MSDTARAYTVTVETTVAASRNKVWKSLVRKTSAWWPAGFLSTPGAKRFVIENELGGRAFEDAGKKAGAIWGTVVVWLPPEKVAFALELYPGWSGPGRSFVSVTLADADGGTRLVLEDCGLCPHSEKAAASLKDGWETLIGKHFKEFVEGGKAGKAKKPKKEKKAGKADVAE